MTVVLPGTGMGNTKEAMVQLERNTSMALKQAVAFTGLELRS